MHFNNMYNADKKEIIVLLCFTFAIMQSCCKNTEDTGQEVVIVSNDCDSIIYELPEKTTNKIVELFGNNNIYFCYVGNDTAENQYYFNFPYIDNYCLTKRDTMLLRKTKTFLKLNNTYLPVIHSIDDIFFNVSRIGGCFNDFNSCYVSVNSRGEIIDSFAY